MKYYIFIITLLFFSFGGAIVFYDQGTELSNSTGSGLNNGTLSNDTIDLIDNNITSLEESSTQEASLSSNPVCKEVCTLECTTEQVCDNVCEDVEKCEDVCREVCGRPDQLFDIRMDIEDASIKNSSELRAVVTYESFGTVPTPINLTFDVFDIQENVVYHKEYNITVAVEEVRRYEFSDLDLPFGNYVLVFTTLYNVDVKDEFRQSFFIEEPSLFNRIISWIRGIF